MLLHSSCYRAFELAPSTGSDISLSFAKDWIETCRTSHKRCRRERMGRLPTRLLELHEGGVRLCITVNATSCQEYVTLSHCWGTLQILKLKTSNIDTLMERVSFESLCKTFQDAVKVTRALGYSYLWIDSLCIVQDDEDDWRKESALMKEVYCNAVVNLQPQMRRTDQMVFSAREMCPGHRDNTFRQPHLIRTTIKGG
jgi:hypothetical protein